MSTKAPDFPGYRRLFQSGELADRAAMARDRLRDCTLCARRCHVDRLTEPDKAACLTGELARVASFGPHFGEEAPLVGRYGSGTIFFSFCNLHCLFCQNWELSQRGDGRIFTAEQLASVMLELQRQGCHNINLVSPSHVIVPFLDALLIATEGGLRLPIVYNTGGYDSLETLALLDGVIDIYMPDMKFDDSKTAQPYLGVTDYAEVNKAAVREMLRQVGHLQVSDMGIAHRGLLIRHLVLPDDLAGTRQLLTYIVAELGTETWVNLMDQYRPCYKASDDAQLGRRITRKEFQNAVKTAAECGLKRQLFKYN